MSASYILEPATDEHGGRAEHSLFSLKLNNELLSQIESGEDAFIEFSSPTEGKIVCGENVFSLQFSVGAPLEVFKVASNHTIDSGNAGTPVVSSMQPLGSTVGRFHAVRSLDSIAHDMRERGKFEVEMKSKKAVTVISEPIALKAPRAEPGANTDSNLAAEENGSNGDRKRKLSALDAENNRNTTRSRRQGHGTKGFDTFWVALRALPMNASGSDIRSFLSGLKVKEVFGYYHRSTSAALQGGVEGELRFDAVDVYVQFESIAGATAALLRNGETISLKGVLSPSSSSSSSSSASSSVKVSLEQITVVEASWAKAVGIRMENMRSKCQSNIAAVYAAIPNDLLTVSPSVAAAHWAPIVGDIPLANEIVSFADHQTKSSRHLYTFRYDYTFRGGGGLYFDEHEEGFGVGLLGDYSVDVDAVRSEKIGPESTSSSHGAQALAQGAVTSSAGSETVDALNKVTNTLRLLSSILGTRILNNALDITEGGRAFLQSQAHSYRGQDAIVTDILYRQSMMYQALLVLLQQKRFR